MPKESEKQLLKELLTLLCEQIDNESCTEIQLRQFHNALRNAVNPLMTRKEAMSFFVKSEHQFDNEISRKMPEKAKRRNIVLYPFKELSKIFGK